MDNKGKEKAPKKRSSLRIKLQKQNLKDERVLRKRDNKTTRPPKGGEKKSSKKTKEFLANYKEAKGIIKLVDKTVRNTGRDIVQLSRKNRGTMTACSCRLRGPQPQRSHTTRRPKINKKPNRQPNANGNQRRTQMKPKTTPQRSATTRKSERMKAQKEGKRGGPSHA